MGCGAVVVPGLGARVWPGRGATVVPGTGVRKGLGVGGCPLPVKVPLCPVGTSGFWGLGHCGMVQQTGSEGSGTATQVGSLFG